MTEEIRNVARLRNVDVYENMSKQELENIFTTQSASIPTPISISRPRPAISIPPTPRPRPRPTHTCEPPSIEMDEFKKRKLQKPDQ